jgi:hypothetical protein
VAAGAGVGVGFSRNGVIGEKYCITAWRLSCTAGPLCNISHSNATCNTPTVTSA